TGHPAPPAAPQPGPGHHPPLSHGPHTSIMRGPLSAQVSAQAHTTPIVEAMEPRVLYSADLAPLVLPAPDVVDTAWLATPLPGGASTPPGSQSSTTPAGNATQSLTEIVFIDGTLPDVGHLLQDLQQQIQ